MAQRADHGADELPLTPDEVAALTPEERRLLAALDQYFTPEERAILIPADLQFFLDLAQDGFPGVPPAEAVQTARHYRALVQQKLSW
jgi:hypothetical protein